MNEGHPTMTIMSQQSQDTDEVTSKDTLEASAFGKDSRVGCIVCVASCVSGRKVWTVWNEFWCSGNLARSRTK